MRQVEENSFFLEIFLSKQWITPQQLALEKRVLVKREMSHTTQYHPAWVNLEYLGMLLV
jgi:hypothetical protein